MIFRCEECGTRVNAIDWRAGMDYMHNHMAIEHLTELGSAWPVLRDVTINVALGRTGYTARCQA